MSARDGLPPFGDTVKVIREGGTLRVRQPVDVLKRREHAHLQKPLTATARPSFACRKWACIVFFMGLISKEQALLSHKEAVMITNVRIGFALLGLLLWGLMGTLASAEQSSGGSRSSEKGTAQEQPKQPDTPPQAGSQGQQGMKGPGSPMEKDKAGDKMIDDKSKTKGKK